MKKNVFLSMALLLSGLTGFSQANVQIIHNCPTPAANSVDIYLYDGTSWSAGPVVSGLLFREATPYVQLPSNLSTMRVAIAPSDATPTIGDTLVSFAVPNLTTGAYYVAMAAGEVGSSTTPFNIFYGAGKATATNPTEFDVNVFHGSTDAPAVHGFIGNALVPAVPNLAYGTYSGFASLPANDLALLLTPAANVNIMVEGFGVPLQTLNAAGGAGILFASGYLNPATGQPAFGLFVALPNGTVLSLPTADLSRIQVVHNSPDPLVGTVDLYIANSNGDIIPLNDVSYKTSTPYLIVPSDNYRAIFCPSNSTDTTSGLVKIPFTLVKNVTYQAIAYGLANTTGTLFDHSESVNGSAVGFTVELLEDARIQSETAGTSDVMVIHHSPDAPAVDAVSQTTGITVIDDIAYGDTFGYAAFPAAGSTVLNVTPGNDNNIVVGSFLVPLGSLSNTAVTVFASGFVTPNDENVNNLAAFGLFAVLPNGGNFIPLPNVTSVENENLNISTSIFPNPATDFINVSIDSKINGNINVQMIDMNGKVINAVNDIQISKGANQFSLNVSSLSNGMYQIHIFNNEVNVKTKFIK